jgi:uncharacterized membrane protein
MCLGRNLSEVGIVLTVTSDSAELMLAIDVDSDPISGWVSNGTKISRPFRGWIELAGVIEAARSAGHQERADLGEGLTERLGSFPGAKGPGL